MEHLTVITRKVSPSIAKCELVTLDRTPISFERVEEQHNNYVEQFFALSSKEKNDTKDDITVIELDPLSEHPDSMFVEDVAVIFNEFAVLTRPGAVSRQGEVAHIKQQVSKLRENVFTFQPPATIDGGDVLVAGKFVFVGQSTRTNAEAVEQFKKFAEPFGYKVVPVDLRRDRPDKKVQQDCMHLKCAVTKLDEKTLLINPNWMPRDFFKEFGFNVVDIAFEKEEEQDAANVLSYVLPQKKVRTIVVAAKFPATYQKLQNYYDGLKFKDSDGNDVRIMRLQVDEIAKAEGALTCCSLLLYK
jgi:dimethylargininase